MSLSEGDSRLLNRRSLDSGPASFRIEWRLECYHITVVQVWRWWCGRCWAVTGVEGFLFSRKPSCTKWDAVHGVTQSTRASLGLCMRYAVKTCMTHPWDFVNVTTEYSLLSCCWCCFLRVWWGVWKRASCDKFSLIPPFTNRASLEKKLCP
jgi:hypothetical protein